MLLQEKIKKSEVRTQGSPASAPERDSYFESQELYFEHVTNPTDQKILNIYLNYVKHMMVRDLSEKLGIFYFILRFFNHPAYRNAVLNNHYSEIMDLSDERFLAMNRFDRINLINHIKHLHKQGSI